MPVLISNDFFSFLSRVIFAWLDPILNVGFSRPLQKEGSHLGIACLRTELISRHLFRPVAIAFESTHGIIE